MKVLVIGGGGREHALIWKLCQSPLVKRIYIYCAPGNAGIAQVAECHPVKADDIPGQIALAKKLKVDLVIVGPETPLVAGITNCFRMENILVFGPTREAAQIEGSKIFCKKLLACYNIPTASFAEFDSIRTAKNYILGCKFPVVIKADGLAFGKGVIIARNIQQGLVAISDLMNSNKFGEAGRKIIIEDFLYGQECSLIVLTDGKNIVPLLAARDYKQLKNNNQGPNTGGMGSYSPVPDVTSEMVRQIIDTIIRPTLNALSKEGCLYTGALYAGLMITKNGPQVLEFNCRFGDPEMQTILPLLESDLVELFIATMNGSLDRIKVRWSDQKAACVVLASKGYPYQYKTGYTINGLEKDQENTIVFHAGTSSWHDEITTNGGRVLNVVGLGPTYETAREAAYHRVKTIKFDDMICRTDIALF